MEILIVNKTNSEMYATLNVVLSSLEKEKTITEHSLQSLTGRHIPEAVES